MRSPALRRAARFAAIVTVLMLLAGTAVHSQPQARTSSRTQMMGSQPDAARRMAERHARDTQEMQQNVERMRQWAQESRDRSIRQTLRASDEQWQRIKPKLDRIERLKAEADVAAIPGSSGAFQGQGAMFGGGFVGGSGVVSNSADIMDPNGPPRTRGAAWGGSWTLGPKSILEMTEGEALCRELQQLLQNENASPAQVAEKVAALRRVRAQAREDLAQTRRELQELMLPGQEPALVLMGYLD